MPINDAQGQFIAATSQGSEQYSPKQPCGVEIDTAVSGRTKAEVDTRLSACGAYKGAAGADNLSHG